MQEFFLIHKKIRIVLKCLELQKSVKQKFSGRRDAQLFRGHYLIIMLHKNLSQYLYIPGWQQEMNS
jgi:hypothetical protein